MIAAGGSAPDLEAIFVFDAFNAGYEQMVVRFLDAGSGLLQ